MVQGFYTPSEEIYNQQLRFFNDKRGDKKTIWFSDFQKNKIFFGEIEI